ncbi:hypothetical protein [Niabella sp.]|uniref:hypothetical protein n=1 Tax=Niabella sp. TaxID=1962976 RepID=UPI002628A7D8|nr:hypothetical protein [Niabella sp.]
MKRLLYSCAKKIRQCFNFRRPVLCQLDYMDLVLENQLLLLISWETRHTYRICIRPGNRSDKRPAGAAVYTLPEGTHTVKIVLKNTWRSTKKVINLKPFSVDPQLRRYLDACFSNEPPFAVCVAPPAVIKTMIGLKYLQPRLPQQPQITAFNISFNPSQFNDYVP